MALDRPRRDFADFDALVGDAVREIPRWSPTWTDHNVHDPGITLIELFAAVTERAAYRSERTTAAHHRAFARRLGLEPEGPRRAETVLALELEPHAGPVTFAAGAIVESSTSDVRFATASDLTVQPGATSLAIVGAEREGWDARASYLPFGSSPVFDASFMLRFDRAPVGDLCLYVWSGATDHDRDLWRRLAHEAAQNPCVDSKPHVHYSAVVTWEALVAGAHWLPIHVSVDETRALTASGFVRLHVPALSPDDTGHYLLRCRFSGGRYDAPPRFQRVIANAVRATHGGAFWPGVAPGRYGVVGVSRGHAGERGALGDVTTLDNLSIRTLPSTWPGGGEVDVGADDGVAWSGVLDWDRTGPNDLHVRLDTERGELRFGDGRIGWVPEAGQRVAVRYRPGGGAVGNVGEGTLDRWDEPSAVVPSVTQPFAALGGADAESVRELRHRTFEAATRNERAVTLADIEALALEAPGLPIRRAKAFAEVHPDFPALRASGCVTLLVIPSLPEARPAPSSALLDALARYLAPRRALTAELVVTGPRYMEIGIAARLHVPRHAATAGLARLASDAFARFIHPIRGGTDGRGWPLGRDLQRAEVMALLMSQPGVLAVTEFAFLLENGERSVCESVKVCPTWLLAPRTHELRLFKEK